MIFKVPSNPYHSTVLWFYSLTRHGVWIGALPKKTPSFAHVPLQLLKLLQLSTFWETPHTSQNETKDLNKAMNLLWFNLWSILCNKQHLRRPPLNVARTHHTPWHAIRTLQRVAFSSIGLPLWGTEHVLGNARCSLELTHGRNPWETFFSEVCHRSPTGSRVLWCSVTNPFPHHRGPEQQKRVPGHSHGPIPGWLSARFLPVSAGLTAVPN